MTDRSPIRAGLCVLLAACSEPAFAATHLGSLADLSLEQLSDVVVTSVSRRDERLGDAASSIYVISGEDIRRSGATSLAEALRLAPNLQVARVNSSDYAITARGGNSTTANKLLVLIDGRTVYTPLFSGVFWDAQAVMLRDVERIEVISGPGTTLWGANAVNGVINVITRSAAESQGTLAEAGIGNREKRAAARYGGALGEDGHYRVYGMASERNDTHREDGSEGPDRSWHGQTGLRADWNRGADRFTLQADLYRGRSDVVQGARKIAGANVLARLNRRLEDDATLTLQAYVDHTERDIPATFGERIDTFDIEFQHGLPPLDGHRVMWGGGYRHMRDRVQNSPVLAFLPPDRKLDQAHLFVQDQWAFNPKTTLTAGLKLEHNPYTGVEHLPNLRLTYKPDNTRLFWGALSRAVRAPSRIDRELFIPGVPPFPQIAGGPNFRSEIAHVAELGYRGQPSAALSYSVTLFHHDYDRLRSVEPAPGGAQLENRVTGTTTGIEAWGSYQVSRDWRMSAGLTAMDVHFRRRPGSGDVIGLRALGNDPDLNLQLRSSYNFSEAGELDLALRHVGSLPDPAVPAYTVFDGRLAWKLASGVELSLTVENLFNRRHVEWGAQPNRSEFGRNLMVRLAWQH